MAVQGGAMGVDRRMPSADDAVIAMECSGCWPRQGSASGGCARGGARYGLVRPVPQTMAQGAEGCVVMISLRRMTG
jgi:hypothetical protein